MEAELRRLVDEDAIRRLTAAYSDAVTALDPARAAAVYAEDGVVSIAGRETAGRPAIEAGMRTSFAAFSLLQLIAHGGVIRVAGGRAEARWSTIELAVRLGATDLDVIFGRYEDALIRLDAGWRFARRTFTLGGRARIAAAKLQLGPAFFAGLPAASA